MVMSDSSVLESGLPPGRTPKVRESLKKSNPEKAVYGLSNRQNCGDMLHARQCQMGKN